MNYLSITADDYGPHPFINAGILEAIEQDLITCVGVLVNQYEGYEFEREMEKLLAAIGDKPFGIGLHLSFTSGKPLVQDLSELLTGGRFRNIKQFKFRKNDSFLAEVRAEMSAQLDRIVSYLEKKGIPKPDHISSHHGIVGLYNPFNEILLQLLKGKNMEVTVRNPLPISKDRRYEKDFKLSFMTKEGFKNGICALDENIHEADELLYNLKSLSLKWKGEQFRLNSCPVPAYFFDTYYGFADQIHMNTIVKKFPYNGNYSYGEVVVHLGKDLGNNRELILNGISNSYFSKRIKEFTSLKDYKQKGGFDSGDIRLIPMAAVPLFNCLSLNENKELKDQVYA